MPEPTEFRGATTDDGRLAREIAPAMRKSLEWQGAGAVVLAGLLVAMGADYIAIQYGTEAFRAYWSIAYGAFLLAIAILAPSYGRRLWVDREVRYRQRNGKWRWEH